VAQALDRNLIHFLEEQPTMRQIILTAALLALSLPALAADPVKISPQTPFAEGISVPDAVRKECGLETQIPTLLTEAAAGGVAISEGDLNTYPGRVLKTRITHILAPGGGPWSGPKSVKVDGELVEGGKVIGSFQARRNATGGGFGTCAMLTRCAQAIAKDINGWLAAPALDSRLGDAK
jgi:hypothetical protein